MRVHGSRVGIVGGSIAGCSAAIALQRLGCEVTVFERSSGALRDRGSGIAIPNPLRDELIGAGYLPEDYAFVQLMGRDWIVHDGSAAGRTLWHQPGPATANNWGVLWRSLRRRVGDSSYRDGGSVTEIAPDPNGVTLTFGAGQSDRFDVVVGADGYRSAVRTVVHPASAPVYAGYVLWRGNFPESALGDRTTWDRVLATGHWLTVGFEGGHGVMYPIPDFEDADTPNGTRVNWAIYAYQPPELVLEGPSSIPPGQVTPALYAHLEQLLDRHFPPELRPVFTSPCDEVSIQPIYDETVDAYTADRLLLIGDAATVSRPHTGSGATKAVQDARQLELLGQEHADWDSLLAAYDADRTPAGRTLVDLGRRIGRDQVEHTPPWAEMTPDDFDAWTRHTLDGTKLYFYANVDRREPQPEAPDGTASGS